MERLPDQIARVSILEIPAIEYLIDYLIDDGSFSARASSALRKSMAGDGYVLGHHQIAGKLSSFPRSTVRT
jgi:hypothetical protein